MPEVVPGYVYVNVGGCLDAVGKSYDYYYKYGMTSNADCASACDGITFAGLEGFSFRPSTTFCMCFFDNGIVTPTIPSGFAGQASYFTGTGEIASTDSTSGYFCYKLVSDFLLLR